MTDGSTADAEAERGFPATIGVLRPVDLEEINRDAELLTRTDRKYIVSASQIGALIDDFADSSSILELNGRRSFSYSTTYHDTPERHLHRDTAHRRPTRFKVRVREYTDTGLAMLEVKTKNGRGRTVKHRMDLTGLAQRPASPHAALTEEMRSYVDSVLETDLTSRLEPALRIDFRRVTLLTDARDARCTIDVGLHSAAPDGNTVDPKLIVIETKSAYRASGIDRWLWAHGVRPTRLSKYCTSMAALDASLPANHWHRQLAAYFPPRREIALSSGA